MSLQIEALLAIYDRLDPDVQKEFTNKIIMGHCSSSTLQNLLERKHVDFLMKVIRDLGFEKSFIIESYDHVLNQKNKMEEIRFTAINGDENSCYELFDCDGYYGNGGIKCYCSGEFESLNNFVRSNKDDIYYAIRDYFMK